MSANTRTSCTHVSTCFGQDLYVPSGMAPHSAYPGYAHSKHTYPWTVHFSDMALRVQSTECTGKRTEPGSPCGPCARLLKHSVIEGIEDRNRNGFSEKTPFQWLTMADAINLLHQKNAQINRLKLTGLNMARSLLSRASNLDAHKCFLMAVGEGNIPGIHRLVSISRKAGESIYTILDKCSRAVRNVYHPKSYNEREFQQLFLFHKLGGVAVAEIAHRALGLPSIEATRRHIDTRPLVASPKMPTDLEMMQNLEHAFPHNQTPSMRKGGFQLMADEIKLESRMRWDPRTNNILGICREHGKRYGLEFRSMAQATALRDGIRDEDVHLASKVSRELLMYAAMIKINTM